MSAGDPASLGPATLLWGWLLWGVLWPPHKQGPLLLRAYLALGLGAALGFAAARARRPWRRPASRTRAGLAALAVLGTVLGAPPGAVRGTGLPKAPGGALERALDATAAMMGEPEAAAVPDVTACLEAHGLLGFADAGWRGTAACYAYAADGSTRSPCDWGKAAGAPAGYAEFDRRSLADGARGGQVLWEVFEPCNVASNVAYYRSMLELCRRGDGAADGADARVRPYVATFAALAWGSAFFHAQGPGESRLGHLVDRVPIELLALVSHQRALSSLPYRPALHDLRDDGRGHPKRAEEYVRDLVATVEGLDVLRWKAALDEEIEHTVPK